jgi:transposase
MRPVGTAAELERRRRRAVRLLEQGESPRQLAKFLGCSRSSLYRWRDMARDAPGGLDARPHPGRARKLDDSQLGRLEGLLQQGALAHGWSTDLWTGPRVATLIRRHFGVRHDPDHVVRLLKRRLGWTSQKPERRARERDEAEIERWKREEFPRIKKRRAQGRAPRFL